MSEETKVDEAQLARVAFERLGLKHWDAFWCGWCESLNERRHRNAEAAPPSVLEALKNLLNVVLDGGSPDDWRDVKYAAKVAIASAEAAEGRAKGELVRPHEGSECANAHRAWMTDESVDSQDDAEAAYVRGWVAHAMQLPPAVEGAGLMEALRQIAALDCVPDHEAHIQAWQATNAIKIAKAALSAAPPPSTPDREADARDAGPSGTFWLIEYQPGERDVNQSPRWWNGTGWDQWDDMVWTKDAGNAIRFASYGEAACVAMTLYRIGKVPREQMGWKHTPTGYGSVCPTEHEWPAATPPFDFKRAPLRGSGGAGGEGSMPPSTPDREVDARGAGTCRRVSSTPDSISKR